MIKFRRGFAFNNLAKSMNKMIVIIRKLHPKIKGSYNQSECKEDILILAYIARKGVLDRMEKFDWPMYANIVLTSMGRSRIPLSQAYSLTVGKLLIMADQLYLTEMVEDVLNKGNTYYEIKRRLQFKLKRI